MRVALAAAGKVALVVTTLVSLASMGGAMLFAAPVLVPLHHFASRRSGPVGTGGWALLAGLSVFEFGWMLAYVATSNEWVSLPIGAVAGTAVAWHLLRSRADAAAREALLAA